MKNWIQKCLLLDYVVIFYMSTRRIPRVGIGGPVGSGKTMLIEQVVPILSSRGYRAGIISNDVVSREDADRMRRNLARQKGLMSEDLVIGLATGGCPHTAVREDN
jgi:urease accessory protein